MTHSFNLAAVFPLVIGMFLLKRAWALHGKARASFLAAASALILSVVLFCFGLGVALGLIVGTFMVSMAGIVASAASADLGRPRLLARPSRQAAPGDSVPRVLARAWLFLLTGPVALCGGLAFGLVALSMVPGADAGRLVGCTLAVILASAALIAWACSDTRLQRATLLTAVALTAVVTAAVMLGAPP